jgi:hypothetical protein
MGKAMSVLYEFLTTDPDPRGNETQEEYYKRRIRRLKLQRLLIRSFPEEFQALDEAVFHKRFAEADKDDKDERVAAALSTYTGRDKFATAMHGRHGIPMVEVVYDGPKALTWIRQGRFRELDDPERWIARV